MPSSSTADATLSCKERFGCEEPLYNNTPHCVLHLPSKEKGVDFTEALNKRLREGKFDFRGVWFPEMQLFKGFTFKDAVFFREATFNAHANFAFAIFEKPVTFYSVTFNAEATFRGAKFKDQANFGSVTFEKPVTFSLATFGAHVDFNSTIFKLQASYSNTTVEATADFSETEFRNLAEFSNARFVEEAEANFYCAKFLSISRFSHANFKLTNFDSATFQGGVNFNSAVFSETVHFSSASFQDRVLFDWTTFKGEVNFLLTNFKDYVRFKGDQVFQGSPPNFRDVIFDKPELVSFHSLTLRPYWFVDVNASEFVLTDVEWDWRRIDEEYEGIVHNYEHYETSQYAHLRIACWNLAVNAEENHRYEEASKFRYLAMEARRRETLLPDAYWRLHWKEAPGAFARVISSFIRTRKVQGSIPNDTKVFWTSLWGSIGILHWLYWLLSGYGERIARALLVLIGIWLIFAAMYAATLRDEAGARLRWRSLTYSAAVMMLQKPEPPPATPPAGQGLVILETILGPVQAALLALAIRRKFMR